MSSVRTCTSADVPGAGTARGDGACAPGPGHEHPDHEHPGHRHPRHGAHAHPHGHGHAELRDLGLHALLGALGLNFVYMCVEALAGAWSGSLALLSDAAHMLSDVMSLAVAASAAWLGRAAVGGRYTFGLRRLPVLGGLFNAVTALGLGVWIVLEAIERLQQPTAVAAGPVLVVATVGLGVNLGSAWWLHRRGGHGVNARGAMLHMMADALGSVAAILSGIVLQTTGWVIIDPLLSVAVAGIVVTSSLPLLRDVLTILLEGAPGRLDLEAMRQSALAYPEVQEIIGLHAWELDSGEAVASFVFVTGESALSRLCQTADALRADLSARFGVQHATVEWRDGRHRVPCCAPLPSDAPPSRDDPTPRRPT